VPLLFGRLDVSQPGQEDARVVDPDSEAAAPRGLPGDPAAGVEIGDVELARPAVAPDPLGRLGRDPRVDVGEVDRVPAVGESPGDLEADAATGTGDDGCGHRPQDMEKGGGTQGPAAL
jgi:hypothetical protein